MVKNSFLQNLAFHGTDLNGVFNFNWKYTYLFQWLCWNDKLKEIWDWKTTVYVKNAQLNRENKVASLQKRSLDRYLSPYSGKMLKGSESKFLHSS